MHKTYSTSQVAQIIGIHPNTVRLYEEVGLISMPNRKANGYRIFTDLHIDQFQFARIALQIEVLQKGLRKKIVLVVKETALGHYHEAMNLLNEYTTELQQEIDNAKDAVIIVEKLLQGNTETEITSGVQKRKDVSKMLGISMDTLRNWEMNGLIQVKRNENGYREYVKKDIRQLKIIRSLRCANYSLSSILRMLNALDRNSNIDIDKMLNYPREDEDIISSCDKLLISLNEAKNNAQILMQRIEGMQVKYNVTMSFEGGKG